MGSLLFHLLDSSLRPITGTIRVLFTTGWPFGYGRLVGGLRTPFVRWEGDKGFIHEKLDHFGEFAKRAVDLNQDLRVLLTVVRESLRRNLKRVAKVMLNVKANSTHLEVNEAEIGFAVPFGGHFMRTHLGNTKGFRRVQAKHLLVNLVKNVFGVHAANYSRESNNNNGMQHYNVRFLFGNDPKGLANKYFLQHAKAVGSSIV